MNVDTAKLRQFMNEFFGPEEFRTFLFDYFRPVYDDLTDGLTKKRQIALLLEYCHSHKKFPDLLAAIERERSFFQPDDYVQGEKAPIITPPAPITRNPRQIFISHAHQDAEVARRLAHDLEAHGYDIWIAPDSIRPGEKWVEAINRGLEESGIFVLLLSADAVASRWVQMETNVAITYTHEEKMQLYPLMLKACRLPALWRAFQHISLRSGYERGVEQLLAGLEPSNSQLPVPPKVVLKDEATAKVVRAKAKPKEPLRNGANSFFHQISGKEFVRVPAGEFLYGDEKKKMHLDEFWMAKTPVTNAEYKRFLDANPNYDVPFVDEDWAKPYNWNKQQRTYPTGKADHPVVLVSWHDAKTFVSWADMELPTEEQWEKAGRGTHGRKYPWGNYWGENHCNTRESGIGETTPVGQFSPQGDSIYGCMEMSGNVWEWIDSLHARVEDNCVLRGGSWVSYQHKARLTSRLYFLPNDRSGNIGFRVVARRSAFQQ